MTLTETLQIKELYLQFQDLKALEYCEKRWRQDGRPATRWEMVNFIERMLRELQQNGIGYPKILLLRKKEIQRGTFTLEANRESGETREPQPQTDGVDFCRECQGKGYLVSPDGSPTLCVPCLGRGRKIITAAPEPELHPCD